MEYQSYQRNTVWTKFLPSDFDHILSLSSSPIPPFDSKKDLFLFLCSSTILLNANSWSFSLDKWSGKKCFMLGARALKIVWGENPRYWSWKPVPESRFPEAAILINVCWLYIRGIFPTKFLSTNTTYGAYFVFMINNETFVGFNNTPVKVYLRELDEEGLSSSNNNNHVNIKSFYLSSHNARRRARRGMELPVKRGDGWLEIEMGRYQVGDHANNEGVELEMTLKEIEVLNGKSGIVVLGIELRPLD